MKLLILLVLVVLQQTILNAKNIIAEKIITKQVFQIVADTSKNPLQLPVMTEAERNRLKNPAEGMVIYNKTTTKPQYFNGEKWVSFDNSDQKAVCRFVGEEFGGGIVFYVDCTGQHGLIASPSDQKVDAQWGKFDKDLSAHDKTIWSGLSNTEKIARAAKVKDIAAVICYQLELNGFNDWYLPSMDELNLMFQNLKAKSLGNLSDIDYWSSSETDFDNAWQQNFKTGIPIEKNVTFRAGVRAIRAF